MKKTIIALTLVVAIAIALSITIPTMAADVTTHTDSTTINGKIEQNIQVDAPTTSGFGIFTDGNNDLTATDGTIRCNFNWQLTVKDHNQTTGTKGHMQTTGHQLAAELLIGATTGATALPVPPTAGAADGVLIEGGTPTAGTDINFNARQAVNLWTDYAGDYTIEIDFIGAVD